MDQAKIHHRNEVEKVQRRKTVKRRRKTVKRLDQLDTQIRDAKRVLLGMVAICTIPTAEARVCCACETVYHQASFTHCPKCGSRRTCTLGDWLGHINWRR